MLWLSFAIGSAFFAGITAVLAKIGVDQVNSTLATAIRTVIVFVFSWLMVLIVGSYRQIDQVTGQSLLFLILSGLSTGASWLCYFKALQLGNVNKVTPIDKSSTILTILLAFFLLGEPLSVLKGIGIVGMGLGTALMLTKTIEETTNTHSKSWFVFAVCSAVFASITSIFGKIGVEQMESNLGTAIRTTVVLLMAWLMVLIMGKQSQIKQITRKSWIFLVLSGISTGLSWLCYYRALQDGPASVVVPIDKLGILITILFSRVILKERISLKTAIGLAFLVVGTGLMLL